MCMSTPSMPAAPAPPPPPPPAPETPTPMAPNGGTAGAAARARGAGATTPMSMIFNIGGSPGLTTPPATTAKNQLGAG